MQLPRVALSEGWTNNVQKKEKIMSNKTTVCFTKQQLNVLWNFLDQLCYDGFEGPYSVSTEDYQILQDLEELIAAKEDHIRSI